MMNQNSHTCACGCHDDRAVNKSRLAQHSRELLCTISLMFLVIGLIINAASEGFIGALFSINLPTSSLILYLLAIMAAWYHVAPSFLRAIIRFRADVSVLMTIAVIGAIAISDYFEAATVAFLYALSLVMEDWSVGKAKNAVAALMDLKPLTARIVGQDGETTITRVETVSIRQTVRVLPGEKIPLDGKILNGATSVDQSPITGESVPVDKSVGDDVFAGTVNNQGAFEFEVTHAANDTTLARIIHRVAEAQTHKAPVEQWIQKFARYYTPAMLAGAVLVAVVPPLAAGASFGVWLYNALVMLVISCPCALLVSTSVSIMAGLASAARAGVLVKGAAYLEAPASLEIIAFDKTGTLTSGRLEVQNVIPLGDHTPEHLLANAAALESYSEHPIARAIVRRADETGVRYNSVSDFQSIRGKGAEAIMNEKKYWIGSHRYVHERAPDHEHYHQKATSLETSGQSVIAVGNDDHVCGLISLGDRIRPDAADAITRLKKLGIRKTMLLTGDIDAAGRTIAEQAGIDEYRAELLPDDKVALIRHLVEERKQVAMVGDGVNDAPALAAATVGIAMGVAGTDAAIETADIALMSDDLTRIPWLIAHSRRVIGMIRQNVAFALVTKAVFMALAWLDLATLWMAIFADMGVTMLVVFNSLRLLKAKLK